MKIEFKPPPTPNPQPEKPLPIVVNFNTVKPSAEAYVALGAALGVALNSANKGEWAQVAMPPGNAENNARTAPLRKERWEFPPPVTIDIEAPGLWDWAQQKLAEKTPNEKQEPKCMGCGSVIRFGPVVYIGGLMSCQGCYEKMRENRR